MMATMSAEPPEFIAGGFFYCSSKEGKGHFNVKQEDILHSFAVIIFYKSNRLRREQYSNFHK